MPPPPGPAALVPPVSLDPAAAAATAQALDELHAALRAIVRADAERAHAVVADWAGFTRRWFDHHHAEAIHAVNDAARQATIAAERVRRALVQAVQDHDRAVGEAERAARVDVDRLAQLAPSTPGTP